MFVIMCMCFSCRYTAYLYHLHLLDETCVHLWWLWRITMYGRDISIPMIADHCIFGTSVDALICCAMYIDSLLDLIWFVWFWFDWYDLWLIGPLLYVHSVFSRFSCISTGKDSPDGGRDQIEGWCEELGGGGVELSHDGSNWCMIQQKSVDQAWKKRHPNTESLPWKLKILNKL